MWFYGRWEARSAKHDRVYELEVGCDLLGDILVEVRYGRGKISRRLALHVPDRNAAQKLVRERLRRRASAPRRIGCSYQLVAAQVGDGEALENWV